MTFLTPLNQERWSSVTHIVVAIFGFLVREFWVSVPYSCHTVFTHINGCLNMVGYSHLHIAYLAAMPTTQRTNDYTTPSLAHTNGSTFGDLLLLLLFNINLLAYYFIHTCVHIWSMSNNNKVPYSEVPSKVRTKVFIPYLYDYDLLRTYTS